MCSSLTFVHRRIVLLIPKIFSYEISFGFHESGAFSRVAKLKIMGSFTSSHKILNEDTADSDFHLPNVNTWDDLRLRCREEVACLPPKIVRHFHKVADSSKVSDVKLRVMQWNVLSQALAISSDKFVACPLDALSWWTRRWRLLEEMASVQPDILCFQEVDHYQFFKRTLGPLGFRGIFFPKPDSPCFYITGNNGPDGCAIFIDETKFELLDTKTRSLEIWGYQSNQVAVLCKLRRRKDDTTFWVATTHLKARQGPFLVTMRREQGKDLLDFIKDFSGNSPVIITGDFNANPSEPVYQTMMNDDILPLDSAYRYLSNRKTEPSYTTWKIREDGEYCQTLDYIFFSRNAFEVENLLQLPSTEDIGEGRVPSYSYPSDHFSLVADLKFKNLDF
ncbi:nocturnin-like isoform X1 [Stegodyphus dumicola]|uniref:nocturnin-like isoform X1 n=2 Tax=Stegodyphus dumicola TaxID=202533 RepID=UPI0015B0D4E7|nr:nocturnin-like isoform X1 [Stegodyphus dumicola]